MALMQAKHATFCGGQVIFDAALGSFDPRFFLVDHWRGAGSLARAGAGRGASWFIDSDQGQWVLRHYRRGGKAAWLSQDRYFYTGLSRTRAFAEWRLLCELTNRGLPVPRPVAARVERSGMTYRADLITATIANAQTLSERLSAATLEPQLMAAVGHCIGRFHAAGVWHADLNAHNVLLDHNDIVYLIDFDRGRLRRGTRWRKRNLQRLHRSLCKLQRQKDGAAFDATAWSALLSAYRKYLQRL
jgi:3-deoxy-D-manno-octulosonic acid kinase